MSFIRPTFFSFLLLIAFSSATFAQPAETGWLSDFNHPPVKINLQLTGQTNPEVKTVNALLNVKLDDGWKTYWRSPGEGGIAPTFDWQPQSKNIKAVDWLWPTPKRYPVLGVETIGYKDQIHFPLVLTLEDNQLPSRLQGLFTLASCTNICVLTDYKIDLSFDESSLVTNDDVAFMYAQAVSRVPLIIASEAIETQQHNANINAMTASWDPLNKQVVVQLSHKIGWQKPDLFIDSSEPELQDIFFAKPQISITDKQVTATFSVSSWSGDVDLTQAKVNITVVDENVAVELSATLGDQVINTTEASLASIFLIALLGGLILNIMPCVLPVLGMKLSSILGTDGNQLSQIRKQFLASSAGILTSFWILATFLLALKFSGEALGWGIQFQNPYFIAAMVVITALFTANMLGLFEIQLPSSWQTWLATKGDHSYIGHYLQGMFATLLATPCSAPFLGTAVAFALGASAWQLFAVFTALGLGMALPWLLIAIFPRIALLLPKPGKWMGTVKGVFALLILATCFWLVSLLSSFIGFVYTLSVAFIILLAFSILIIKKQGKTVFLKILASVLLVAAGAFIVGSLTAKYWAAPLQDDIVWQPLQAELIQQQVAAGNTVFVDVTADWCVTCKANKIGVILQDPVYSALQADAVIAVKGDWTVRSNSVTTYLQSFGRYGVPFNVVYGPAAPNGIALSTVLSSQSVLEALQQAKGQ